MSRSGKIVVLGIVSGLLLETAALVIGHLASDAAGIAWHHIVIEKDGKFYETYKGGGPVSQRTLKEITPQQYRIFHIYQNACALIMLLGMGLLLGCFAYIVVNHVIAQGRCAAWADHLSAGK